jgi:hypothetical protein
MHGIRGIFLCLALSLWGIPVLAQWSGSADLSGGLGGMSGSIASDDKPMFHGLVKGTFMLNYKTEKFNWTTTLNGNWEPNTTDNSRLAFKNERLGIVYKSASTKPLSVSLRSDFQWTLSPDRNYAAWIRYKIIRDRAYNHSINMDGGMEDVDKFSYYYEVPTRNAHNVETGLRTYRRFNDGRSILHSSLVFGAETSRQVNTWSVFKVGEGAAQTGAVTVDVDDEIQGYAWRYRITPNNRDFSLDGDIHLQRTPLEGTVRLKYAPGLRLSSRHAMDENSGATRIGFTIDSDDEEDKSADVWRDSTRLRENFNFLNLRVEPYVTADFQWKNIEAHADLACQVYARRLNDDSHQQPLKVKGVYPVGKADVKWSLTPRHSLQLGTQMSVSHPDYLKICWYDRTAGYMDQLYRGNEQLLSPETRRYALTYEYKAKRFSSKSTINFTRVSNEIDQTWSNEEIDGRMYKVFRWLNSSDSRSVGLTQQLGWQGKVITAHTGMTYTQSRRRAKSGDTVKDSFNWGLNGDILARLGKGWSLGADAHYQSKVATFFTIFKEYCELNARVQKEFKRVTLYLEGRDLLDQARETSFESDELQEYWVEEVRHNRRIFVLGAKWNF